MNNNNKYLLFGGILITLFLLLLIPFKTFALEGDCPEKYCFVPAPTIVMPEIGQEVGERPAFRALTWKPTYVKVFVDGLEIGNIEEKKHEDQYASIFVQLDYNLKPGNHYVYMIAYHEKGGWGGVSKESRYINFTVKEKKVTYLPPQEVLSNQSVEEITQVEQEPKIFTSETILEDVKQKEEAQIGIIATSDENNIGVIGEPVSGDVEIKEQGMIEGGVFVEKNKPVSDLQEAAGVSDLGEILNDQFIGKDLEQTQKRNRFIGLIMLIIILSLAIIWFGFDYLNSRRMKILDQEDEGYLPPPPTPPKDRKKGNEEISYHEVTDEWIDQVEGPPSSPSSPYPIPNEELEVIDEEKRNDLGL